MLAKFKNKGKIIVIIVILFILFVGGRKFVAWRNHIVQEKAHALYLHAETIRQEKKWQEAIDAYKSIIKQYPSYDNILEVKFMIANIYLHQLVIIEDARHWYENILKQKRRFAKSRRIPDTLIELATIYRAHRKHKEAIALLEEALEKYPEYVDRKWIYFQLEMLYGMSGNREKEKEMMIKQKELK